MRSHWFMGSSYGERWLEQRLQEMLQDPDPAKRAEARAGLHEIEARRRRIQLSGRIAIAAAAAAALLFITLR